MRSILLLAGMLALSVWSSAAAIASIPQRSNLLPTHSQLAADAYASGTADLRAGHYAAAEKAFELAIKRHQHVADAYEGVGTAAVFLHSFVAAFHAFQHAVQLQPHNPTFQYHAAYGALYAGDYHAAVVYATNYIGLRRSDPQGYHLRFLAEGQLLDHKAQVRDARQVVRLQPHSASAYNDLGIALTNDRQYAAGAAAFTTAIRLKPGEATYYSNRAQTEDQQKKYAAALADLRHARSLTTDSFRRKQLDGAIKFVEKQMHH